jgi:hypothetical protein
MKKTEGLGFRLQTLLQGAAVIEDVTGPLPAILSIWNIFQIFQNSTL